MSAPSTATRPQDPWETTWTINHTRDVTKRIDPFATPLSFRLKKVEFHGSMEAYECTLIQGSPNNGLNTLFDSGLRFLHFRGDQLTLAALPPLEFPIAKYDANWQHIPTVDDRLRGAFSPTTERLIAAYSPPPKQQLAGDNPLYVVLYRAPNTVKSKKNDYIDDILLYELITFQGRDPHESGSGGGYSIRP